MPICYPHNCLFVHIPRTAGTSIEKAFGIYQPWPKVNLVTLRGPIALGSEEYQLQHLSLRESAQFARQGWAEKCFTFAFTRNPWDRLVSEYHWCRFHGIQFQGTFEEFIEHVCRIVRARVQLIGRNCHLRPQVEYIDGDLSFLGKFENLTHDIDYVFSAIGLKRTILPHANASIRGNYPDYYNQNTRKKVEKVYEQDIETFKYRFDPCATTLRPRSAA